MDEAAGDEAGWRRPMIRREETTNEAVTERGDGAESARDQQRQRQKGGAISESASSISSRSQLVAARCSTETRLVTAAASRRTERGNHKGRYARMRG